MFRLPLPIRSPRKGTKAGRPKGSPNRKTEREHREIAAAVDAFVAATGRLKYARAIVAEEGFVPKDRTLRAWVLSRLPDYVWETLTEAETKKASKLYPSPTTVRTAHNKYGRLFGKGGGKNIPPIYDQ